MFAQAIKLAAATDEPGLVFVLDFYQTEGDTDRCLRTVVNARRMDGTGEPEAVRSRPRTNGPERGNWGGRYWTRTSDLSRVRRAL